MNLKKLSIEEFVAEIKVGGSYTDHRYTLFLGAGCSKSSGIPTAGELVLERWIPKMAPSGEDPIEWAENHIDGFDRTKPAASYGAVIEQCFRNPRVRQAEIERICEVAWPKFGYSVVAQLCTQSNTPFSAVLTTNFDNLVAGAMITYTNVHPIVISDESLANQIHSTRSGPMVIKLHGDARLSPKNTTQETEEIDKAVREQAKKLLDGRGLLFFGYAGADNSVFKMLDELRLNALELGVYWINENPPSSEQFRKWLEEREATWVLHNDFDKAMRHFRREYDLDPLKKDRIDKVFNENKFWSQQARTDRGQIAANFIHDEEKARLMAETKADHSSIDAWRSVNSILKMEEQYPDAAFSAYQAAVSKYPKFAPLLNNYANLLAFVRGDHDKAETFYKRAIDADPKNAIILESYAIFLTNVRDDHNTAEAFYKRGIDADPKNAGILGNYANFLTNVRGDHDKAETFYKRAIDADWHAIDLGSYANFLTNVRGDHDKAETFYKRAIDADPKNAHSFNDYAFFLTNVRGDHDKAEDFYERGINADPKNARILGNYGEFLLYRGERDRGFDFLDRSDQAAKDIGYFNRMIVNDIYRAIYSVDAKRSEVLSRLHISLRYIKVPRPFWSQAKRKRDLSAAAVEDRKWLAKLIDVSEGKAKIDELDEWPQWQEASSGME